MYQDKVNCKNMDAQVKQWLLEDFNITLVTLEDLYPAKEQIKKKYAELYKDVFLESESDRQGWTRVWLSEKIRKFVEENNTEEEK